MNEYDKFLKALLLRNTGSKAPENHSRKSKGKLVDGPKSFPGKQTADWDYFLLLGWISG